VFGSSGDKPGQFSSPWGLVVDSEGTIVVADQTNDRIQIFNYEGEFLKEINRTSSSLSQPLTPAIDREGNLVITDYSHNRIQVFG